MKIIKKLSEVDIEKVYELYDESFNDEIEYRKELFNTYLKYSKFFGVLDNDKLVMMTFFNPKRIYYKNTKMNSYLIFAVAVSKNYQKKGYMKKYLSQFIDEINIEQQPIFIQAYNWDIYKSFNFITCSSKSNWILRKDQFLKYDNILDKIDYDLINKINTIFLRNNQIENFIYKTEKENKKYLKLHKYCGNEIIMSNKSYVIWNKKENIIHEYSYIDLKDFIKLVSSLPYGTKIESLLPLDKKFFTKTEEAKPFTKILKNNDEGTDIFFMDNW